MCICRHSLVGSTDGVDVYDPTDICDYVESEEALNLVACLGTTCESVSRECQVLCHN